MIRILYVDDEGTLLDVCKQFLERSGEMKVDTATSAMEALQKMRTGSYDAIISDYQMPETYGLEFLKLIRSKDDPSHSYSSPAGAGKRLWSKHCLSSIIPSIGRGMP